MLDAVIVNAHVHCGMCVVRMSYKTTLHCKQGLRQGWYDELKLLKGNYVCRSNTHPDMKSHVIERLATDHN